LHPVLGPDLGARQLPDRRDLIRLLVDHRERLVRTRVTLNGTLEWNLHDLSPKLALPAGTLFSKKWTSKIARRAARAEQTMHARIARDELRRVR
jgi:hypothetical protein